MGSQYLTVGCPKCHADRGVECTGSGVAKGMPHPERKEWFWQLENQTIERVVDRELG